MTLNLKKKIGCVLAVIALASPVMAKVTIGAAELSMELKNVTEVMKQIKKMEEITEYKKKMCDVLGADMCNAIANQIATCTKSALKKLDKDIMDIDKENLIKAANACAGDLYISECIDAGYDALNDVAKKQTSLENLLGQTNKKSIKFWDNAEAVYTNALTGDTLKDQISSTEKSLSKSESLYKQLGGGDVSKSYIGNATQKLFQQATTPTKNMELVNACAIDALSAAEWVPSVTTLSSSEMAPSVPSQIKSILIKSEENGADLISKIQKGGTDSSNFINDKLSGVTATLDKGFSSINDAEDKRDSSASLYNKSETAVTDITEAKDANDVLKGVRDIWQVVDKTGVLSYFDPLNEPSKEDSKSDSQPAGQAATQSGAQTSVQATTQSGAQTSVQATTQSGAQTSVQATTQSGVQADSKSNPKSDSESDKNFLESSWDVVSESSVEVAGGIKYGIEEGSAHATAGVGYVDSKVSEVQEEIVSLVFAGMKKTADAGASLVSGKPESADVNDVRENQNQLQINALSSGIGSGQKSSALVGASGEELVERSNKIEMSSDIFNMLKEIAGLSAQSLQKNNAITALKSQLLEMGSLDNITAGGVLNRSE